MTIVRIPLILLILFIILNACNTPLETENVEEIEVLESVSTDVIVDFIDDDIERMVLFQLFSLFEDGHEDGGVVETHLRQNPFALVTPCSSVIRDLKAQTIMIDFGEGCENQTGLLRSGRIIIELIDQENDIWKNVNVSLIDYRFENISVLGNRSLTIDPTSEQPYANVHLEITSGSISFSDNSDYFYESSRTRTYIVNPYEFGHFHYEVTVDKRVVDRNTNEFTLEAKEDNLLSYWSECFDDNIRQPVFGLIEYDNHPLLKSVDFGGGSCSTQIVVITSSNERYSIDLGSLIINN